MSYLAVLLFLSGIVSPTQTASPVKRPHILGVAHMALYVTDLQKARAFYKDFLGYEEPYTLKREDGSDRIAFIKINEDQYLELFAEAPKQDGRLNHISFFTDSAEAMRAYLASKGVKVPEKVGKGKIGNSNFNVTDPDGHTVEIVQYEPDSWTRREKARRNYTHPIEIKTGVNGKRQANLFDPDGTRIELMEPNTADGKPVPPSRAPAPK